MATDRDAAAVARALSRAFDEAQERSIASDDARLIVLSDQHKGARDAADDFQRCEPAYCAALAWYLESGYTLYVLGDAEELWENSPAPVLADATGYPEVLRLEAEFLRAGRYERFYGNHDDLWANAGAVRKHLRPFFGDRLKVREALRLRLTRSDAPDGVVFLAHGHQGTTDSDRFGWLSHLIVRWVWRPIQRRSGYTGVTPSRDHKLRSRHDRRMAAWAGAHPSKPVLIAGHTHRPVFSDSMPDPGGPTAPVGPGAADERAAEEFDRARARNRATAFTLPTPCYFNSGCCCFGDGDLTGIEVSEGEIRLVRWPADDGTPQRKILARRGLDEVLDAVAGRDPRPVAGQETTLGSAT